MTAMSALRAQPAGLDGGAAPREPTHPEPVARDFGAFEKAWCLGARRSADVVDTAALDHLTARLETGRHAYLSLDVFDTLLLRNDKCERRRFWEIAGRWETLLPKTRRPVGQMDLYLARLRAAQICYSCGPIRNATQEGRLDNLVGVTLSLLNLPSELQPAFVTTELAYEAENLVPNPLIVALVEQHRRRGGQIVLLSDMYVAGADIHALILKLGIGDIAPHIYSSADNTLNKRTGTIFGPVANALGIKPGGVLHIGDSFHSDYVMPLRCGWAAQHLPVPLEEERARARDLSAFLDLVAGAE